MTISFHDLSKLNASERARLLRRTEADLAQFEEKVKPIIEAVRRDGDEALARFAREFDKSPVEANAIAATGEDFARAEKTLDPKVREALAFMAVAGAAREHPGVLIIGLALSVALMGLAASLIARLLQKHRWIAYLGLAVILYVALDMIYRGILEVYPAMF